MIFPSPRTGKFFSTADKRFFDGRVLSSLNFIYCLLFRSLLRSPHKKDRPRKAQAVLILLFSSIRNERNVSCSLDSYGKLSLVLCAGTGDSSGKNLGTLRNKAAKLSNILIVYEFNLIDTELADFTSGLSVSLRSVFSFHNATSLNYNQNGKSSASSIAENPSDANAPPEVSGAAGAGALGANAGALLSDASLLLSTK